MAIFEIKIRNYMLKGEFKTTEAEVYTIPLSEGTNGNDYVFTDPKVKSEMGKTGSFEFTVYPNHPLYDSWLQMKTMLRVKYFDATIFYGRVLTVDFDPMSFKKSIHCEGYMAFLMDSLVEGLPESARSERGADSYITELITNHNNQFEPVDGVTVYPNKRFDLGFVPGLYPPLIPNYMKPSTEGPEGIKRYGSSSWQNTADALAELTKEFGGFFRTRYDESNDKVYLDWLCGFFNDFNETRVVEVTKNIVSISSSTEVDNLFTVLIPIGKRESGSGNSEGDNIYLDPKFLYVKDIGSHFTDEQLNDGIHSKQDYEESLNKFGIIYKSVNFSNAKNTTDLSNWAWDYIKNNYNGENMSFTVSAVDMRVVDGYSSPIMPGDRIKVIYTTGNGQKTDKTLVVISAEWDLHNPEQNSYTIGVPGKDFQKTYGKASDKKGGKGSGGGPSGGGPQNENEKDDTTNEVRYEFKEHLIKASENSEEYQSYKQKYGDNAAKSILKTTDLVLDSAYNNEDQDEEAIVRKIILDANDGTVTGYSMPAVPSIINPKRRQAIEIFKNFVLDASNNVVTFKDRLDLVLKEAYTDHPHSGENYAQFVQKAVNYIPGNHAILEMGVDSIKQENQTQQYLRFKMHKNGATPQFTQDGEISNLLFNQDTTGVVNGETGTLTTSSIELATANSTLIDQISEKAEGVQSTISLKGNEALMEMNRSNDASQNSSKSFVIEGFSGTVIGTDFSAVPEPGQLIDDLKGKAKGLSIDKIPTIDLSGSQAKVTTSADNTQTNFEINAKDTDGQGNTIPTVVMGPTNNSGTTEKKWSITLNKPYTYTYTDPDTQQTKTFTVPDHSIDVNDIHFTNTFDSVKAKIAVIDQLIANNIDANTITSMKATIDAITGTTIHADRRVSAGTVSASSMVTNSITTNQVLITVGGGSTNVAGRLFRSYRFGVSGSRVTLYGTQVSTGNEIVLASFEIPSSGGGDGE